MERAILVNLATTRPEKEAAEESLDELAGLARMGAEVHVRQFGAAQSVLHRRRKELGCPGELPADVDFRP
jgi:hypothetical protein